MIHPATELRLVDRAIGHGVYATTAIPRGTILWVRDPLDRAMTPAEIAALPPILAAQIAHHFWVDRNGSYLLAWDLARFVNHSCRPNCVSAAAGLEIAIVDIAAGEQITNDYAELGMLPGETMGCGCGAPGCRGVVTDAQADIIRLALRDATAEALARAPTVAQPLAALLTDAVRRRLLEPPPAQPGRTRRWRIRDLEPATRVPAAAATTR